MTNPTPRPYNSKTRRAQARKTQDAVISAATEMFRKDGWAGTTIAAVARLAGTSQETVYSRFGTKKDLLSKVIENSVRRDAPDTPLLEQGRPARVFAAATRAEQISLFCADITDVLSNVAPLMIVLRTAAATELDLAQVYQGMHKGRRKNIAGFVDALARHHPALTAQDQQLLVAEIWRLASPELFVLLTDIEGMSLTQFAAWLNGALSRVIKSRTVAD